jgi:hypothetical protein
MRREAGGPLKAARCPEMAHGLRMPAILRRLNTPQGGRRQTQSVPGKHERLNRQQQRLDAQQHGVHQPDGIDRMQREASQRTRIL